MNPDGVLDDGTKGVWMKFWTMGSSVPSEVLDDEIKGTLMKF